MTYARAGAGRSTKSVAGVGRSCTSGIAPLIERGSKEERTFGKLEPQSMDGLEACSLGFAYRRARFWRGTTTTGTSITRYVLLNTGHFSLKRSSSPNSRSAFKVSSMDCLDRPSGGLASNWMVSFSPGVVAKRDSTLV